MTFSVPSFLAAATSALMPPAALRELAVETSLLLPELLVVLPEPPPLLHPAAKTSVPTAAVATTANFPRKTFLPDLSDRTDHIMARQVGLGVACQWRTEGWPVTGIWPKGIDSGTTAAGSDRTPRGPLAATAYSARTARICDPYLASLASPTPFTPDRAARSAGRWPAISASVASWKMT